MLMDYGSDDLGFLGFWIDTVMSWAFQNYSIHPFNITVSNTIHQELDVDQTRLARQVLTVKSSRSIASPPQVRPAPAQKAPPQHPSIRYGQACAP